ncbi:hypothetical protein PCANB_002703 [Pneumocystis canis]|nr:hypothetical protein PCK1_002655 [Pneumocystis canis]KAG5438597.1 hypothetical protein PCANB_002703 [Pneumocystis canis]
MSIWILHPNQLSQKKTNLWKLSVFKPLFIQKRNFLNPTSNKSQTFSTYSILPYEKSHVFSIISDINSYSTFLPYCLASKVTTHNKNGLPQTADLRIGWKKYDVIFSSRIDYISHDYIIANASNHYLFQKLQTTWFLKEIKTTDNLKKNTKISLTLDFKFYNPLYTIISMTVIPTISTLIITSFENRIKQIAKIKN